MCVRGCRSGCVPTMLPTGRLVDRRGRMTEKTEFIPKAGACLVSVNVLSGAGRVRWMVRKPSQAPVDNGWWTFSSNDTSEILAEAFTLQISDFTHSCAISPSFIGIYYYPSS